jgi:hypothetical protein
MMRPSQVRCRVLEAVDRDERMPQFGLGVNSLDGFHDKIIAAMR